MIKSFNSLSKSAAILLFVLLAFTSCKKKNDDNPDSNKFPLSNLSTTITARTLNPASNSVSIAYDVKNISTADYSIARYVMNVVRVKATIVATDGTVYESNLPISDLRAGATVAMEQVVAHSAGKTPDLTKTKVELTY
ncbi:hypothetical protein [Pedobacter sp. UBA5917]|jgi:hypothetical protein|uniref:hypothetical protein n=1 Tax=Pedobacter sp. UBA5917 TaxID=1947061 RepID=UPI0025E12188|nr:hypothetical protein [Pedobacter sp. UBA5917]